MDELLNYLRSLSTGQILDTSEMERLLAGCWEEFRGGDAEGMAGYKLLGRMHNVDWSPPVLTFLIERHGGTVLGSSRAERHAWTLNVKTRTADCQSSGYAQLRPMQARLDITPIANEIAQLIIDRRDDERLKWNKDGSVRIQVGKILPAGSAVKQTLAGRRKRLSLAIEGTLRNSGWEKLRTNLYARRESFGVDKR